MKILILQHGYKVGGNSQQQQSSLRVRRQNTQEQGSSLLTESLRFDGNFLYSLLMNYLIF